MRNFRKLTAKNTTKLEGKKYYKTKFQKHNNLGLNEPIVIENGFKDSMDVINTIAVDCGISVAVTKSFRPEQKGPDDQLSPPSDHSSHVIGHAIDFLLKTPSGVCDRKCITEHSDYYGKCFAEKIARQQILTFGPDSHKPGPAHLANEVWKNGNAEYWNRLYYSTQQDCTVFFSEK